MEDIMHMGKWVWTLNTGFLFKHRIWNVDLKNFTPSLNLLCLFMKSPSLPSSDHLAKSRKENVSSLLRSTCQSWSLAFKTLDRCALTLPNLSFVPRARDSYWPPSPGEEGFLGVSSGTWGSGGRPELPKEFWKAFIFSSDLSWIWKLYLAGLSIIQCGGVCINILLSFNSWHLIESPNPAKRDCWVQSHM